MLENDKTTTVAVPDWVIRSFVRSATHVGAQATSEELTAACRALIDIWSTPDRKVHNMTHVVDMLQRVDTLAPEAREPDYIRLATWYHGVVFSVDDSVVYAHNGGEDELASADVARAELSRLGVPQEACEAIAALITSLHHRHSSFANQLGETQTFDAIDSDQIALRDAHLGVLACDPKRYKKYNALTREEYAAVDNSAYFRARSRILTRLLSRKRLFISPLAAPWEETARQNAAAELERIKALIAQHEPSPSQTAELPAVDAEAPAGSSAAKTHIPIDDADAEPSAQLTAELLAQSEPEEEPQTLPETDDVAAVEAATFRRLTAEEFRSTLEDPDDSFDPGVQPRILSGPEVESAKRQQIARNTLELINSKRRKAEEAREAEASKEKEDPRPTSTMEKVESIEDDF
ncbi:putative metal-dependent HD superfamily phosphohydrolase [Arcanobacterium wilhelmae]|uniref:Metal-dependent HD superfamily phosphohydrolase n=1 Tax=Arcanobacterium wilhelmae TaxID=1803177 RepID=A0ABT9NBR1_9ACTO|nr:hypothetical protein [Arcanobacterium wilhelmae]MDP9801155.1 putative metal-dependent HD superfamily phosphohydrolase [Arcanobacterium wilhelmae]WFN90507.1 hypothetical protein P8A24_01200 [Arcanobacterium wilhelmae]